MTLTDKQTILVVEDDEDIAKLIRLVLEYEGFEVRHAAAWKRTEFGRRAPGIDWPAFFAAADLQKQPTVVVWQPAAVTGLPRS